MSFKVDRRGFFKFAGGGALGAAASGFSLHQLADINQTISAEEIQVPGGPETWVPGICTLCPGGCGLRVRKIGARAVKIQGNPLHPVNRGGLCPKGLAGLQALYHPDRLKAPFQNVGSRKSPRWKQISWQQAMGILTTQLRKLRDAGQAQGLVLINRPERNLLSLLLRRFLSAYGSPNYLTLPTGLDAVATAMYLQQGVTQPVAYDLERTRYVLSFGVNLLEGWGSPVSVMRAFGHWRDSASGRRTKFVQAESRFSLTAARADEWVALKPGTEAALALGMAYVLITEGLYDASFVRDHTFGFEAFRALVLSEYRLNEVAALTNVPEETILRVAREFAANRPAIALGDRQTSTLAGDPYAAMAIHSLNALAGSIDAPGGVLVQAELPLLEEGSNSAGKPRIDQAPESVWPGHHLARLPEAITTRKPYPVEAVILHDVDPVFSMPNGPEFRESLSEVPFVASFSSFPDETASIADLVLPVSTGLENWQEATSPPTFPHAVHSISPPVVAPRYQARHAADIFLEAARSLGGPVAQALPFASFEEYLHLQAGKLFELQTGSVFSTGLQESWNRLLERSGWWSPTYSSADELWEQMKEHGGWWDPAYYYGEWERVLRTPSGRFEFHSEKLAKWTRPAKPSSNYPLLLLAFEVLPLAGGEGGHLPYLQQIAGQHLFVSWESWLEIHPDTAKKHHIEDGDMVWVESRRGRVQVRARIYEGARPDVVNLPLGYGRQARSEWGQRGVNPLRLLEKPQTASTYVKVYRS